MQSDKGCNTYLSLNKSTTHRIIRSLQYMGYVRQNPDTGNYECSFRLVGLAIKITENTDITRILRPFLKDLMIKTGETVHLVRRKGAEVNCIDKLESDTNVIRMVSHIGNSMPFYRTAVGKAIAADMSEEKIRELWEQGNIQKATPTTITSFQSLLKNLREIKGQGYAVDNEENEIGIQCVGASIPLQGYPGDYAFSVSVTVSRMNKSRIRDLTSCVMETRKRKLSEIRYDDI